jgi:hypothetical protein
MKGRIRLIHHPVQESNVQYRRAVKELRFELKSWRYPVEVVFEEPKVLSGGAAKKRKRS